MTDSLLMYCKDLLCYCTARCTSQSLGNCMERLYAIDLASVSNLIFSRQKIYVFNWTWLHRNNWSSEFKYCHMQIKSLLFYTSENIDAVLTEMRSRFINYFCHKTHHLFFSSNSHTCKLKYRCKTRVNLNRR